MSPRRSSKSESNDLSHGHSTDGLAFPRSDSNVATFPLMSALSVRAHRTTGGDPTSNAPRGRPGRGFALP